MRSITPILVLAFACCAICTAQAATTKTRPTRPASAMHPKITAGAAQAIAQTKVPAGRVKAHELERESGHLIYSFAFVVPGKSGIDEVNVDAMTGAILAVSHEDATAERKEVAKEKREAKAIAH
jgi:peptidase YpeB-like protein